MTFKKGHKGGPGRPKKKPPEKATSTTIRQRFFETFMTAFTPQEMSAFVKKSQLNKRLFLQEIRRMLPVFVEQDIKTEFKPLQVVLSTTDAKEIESSKVKLLEGRVKELNLHLEAATRALRQAGLEIDLPHEPERPPELTQGQDGVFKSDADRLLTPDDEDPDDDPGDDLPPAPVVN